MPRQDGTGPAGKGPKTGRGLGPCNTSKNTGLGRGQGRGPATGRGQGRGLGTGRGMGPLNRGNR